ncbi:MAG: hypothetical protein RLZ12_314 [Bacillota bacterium]|jgi:single-strand DNA-binding protein
MLNKAILVGRLTKDPELRYTASGVALSRFTIALDRRFTNQQGERTTDFINIVTWRGLAENCAKYLRKGSLAGIDGRIQTGKYENQEGRTIYTTDVVADDVRFLESRAAAERNRDTMQDQEAQAMTAASFDKELADPFAEDAKPVKMAEEDLPF